MHDLFAITGRASETTVRLHGRKNYRECKRRNVYMRIDGDQTVDSLFYDDPELTLICRSDLLSSERYIDVAAYLAGLYRQQGDRFARELRGTFAIVLFDHRHQTLKAWIDHFGGERLVWAQFEGSLAVSTDIAYLLKVQRHPPGIRPAAIQEYLQYTCIPAPGTVYQNICKVPPGHQLISRPEASTQPYWDIVYDENDPEVQSENVWAAKTQDAVRSAVALSLKNLDGTDTPGCFLSGGTDSSSIAGLVGQITDRPPRTFSIGFDDPRYNEIQYARIAATRFRADHHEYFVKPDDIPVLAQNAAGIYDEPFGNSSIVPTYYCARLAADHGITHLLAGDGGDELFGGNARYSSDRIFQHYGRIPRWTREWLIEPCATRAARWTNARLFQSTASYVRRSNIPAPDRYLSYSLISSLPGPELFTSDFLKIVNGEEPLTAARTHFRRAPAQSELNRWLYLDLKITIADNDLRKVASMSRLAGVKARFPLLNPALAEFTGTIPPELKVKGTRLRYLFKKAMSDLLPRDIVTKTKHGFGLPYSVWLAESKQLRDFTFDILRSASCRQRGYFRSGLIDWLWSQYESVHRAYYGEILWILLMLELWHVKHSQSRVDEDHQAATAVLGHN